MKKYIYLVCNTLAMTYRPPRVSIMDDGTGLETWGMGIANG